MPPHLLLAAAGAGVPPFSFRGEPATDLQPFFDPRPGVSSHWIGSDCATSLPRHEGRRTEVLWVFQDTRDTRVGALNATTGRRTTRCMPHNSLGTRAGCSPERPPAGGAPYPYADNATNGFFAPPNRSQFYWVETGARDPSGTLHLFAQRMSRPCSIGCTQHGIDLISVADEAAWRYATRRVYFLGSGGGGAFLGRLPRAELGRP
eukprot:gene20641-28297_t